MTPDEKNNENTLRRQNLMAGLFVVAFIVAVTWLMGAFRSYVKIEECLEAHHRNCVPIEDSATQ